jgi:ribosome-associated protein
MNDVTDRSGERPLVNLAVRAALDKKGEDPVALDVSGLVAYTDAIVIVTARNERLAKAIHDEIYAQVKSEEGVVPARVDGLPEARWVLMDYLDVIVHVMVPDARERYRLEALWGEAPRIDLDVGDAAGDALVG